jgi:hypothetical protein
MMFVERKLWWGGTALVAVLLVLGGLGLVEMPKADPRVTEIDEKPTRIAIAQLSEHDENSLAESQLLLQDPTPLFLPTEFNSGKVRPPRKEEQSLGTSFSSIPAKMLFGDTDIQLALPEVVSIPERALDLVIGGEHQVKFTELARENPKGDPLSSRQGYLKVLSFTSGSELWSQEISGGALEFELEAPWEFVVAVNRAGLMSFPAVVNAGEGALIDIAQITEVLREKRLGARLDPGIYRILLGP